MSISMAGASGGLDVNGTTVTDTLKVMALDCTLDANGGKLTTNASGEVVCSDDGDALAEDNACIAGGVPGKVVSGFDDDGVHIAHCFRSVVTTLAGSGVAGSTNGTGTAAEFDSALGVAVDLEGNVYVADSWNHVIRMITPAGEVTTLAGNGVGGYTNGTGTAAQFNYPFGLILDETGNIYVADTYNHVIRMITPAGEVTTLAGTGVAGFANGRGASAQFDRPGAVTVDETGNVYVADTWNQVIRMITPAGEVTTLAGNGNQGFVNGPGSSAEFSLPRGIAAGAGGIIYVADFWNNQIRKITSAGDVSTLAGSTEGFADGTGGAALFYKPWGLAVDRIGNIYVGDKHNHRIRKVTAAGVVTTLAGSTEGFADGTGAAAKFNQPAEVAVDGAFNIYVADAVNHRIRRIK